MSISIEQILSTTEGQQQIGSIMATDHLFDAVMQHMSLLDIDSTIIKNVVGFYDAKCADLKISDLDAQSLVSDADIDVKNSILSVVDTSSEVKIDISNSELLFESAMNTR